MHSFLDILFCLHLKVLFQVSIGMISLKEKEILASDNSAQIFNILSTLPASIQDVETLLKVSMVHHIEQSRSI